MGKTIIAQVTGLTCQHCVGHVSEELTALEAVNSVQVELNPQGASRVEISLTPGQQLSDQEISAALDEAGDYQLQEVRR